MKRLILFSIIILAVALIGATEANAATITVSANTNWSALTGGSGTGGLPSSADVIIVDGGATLTVNVANAVCASIQLGGSTAGTGAGTLAFNSGSQVTVSGVVTVGMSTVRLGSINMTNGGTLICQSFMATATYIGTWTPGTGTVILTATNTLPTTIFTSFNNLTISAGTTTLGLNLNSTAAGTLTVNAGATLALSTFSYGATTAPTSLTIYSGATTGSSITGSGALTLGGNVTVNNAGTGTSGATISAPVALGTSVRTFTVADNGTTALDFSMSGIVSGTGGITKAGTGAMELSALNTYTGATTVSAGILRATNNTVVASTAGPFGNNASGLNLGGGTIQSNVATFSRPLTVTATNSGLDAYGSARTVSSAINLATAGTFNLNVGGTTVASTEGQALTLSGIISNSAGTLGLTKIGTSTVIVSNTNTFTGGVTLSAGTLDINNASALGTVAGTFTINGGTIDNTSGANITTANYPLALNGDFTYAGSVPRSLNFGAGAVTLGANRQITVSATSGADTLTIGGAISAAALNLTKAGTQTLAFGSQTVTLDSLTISAGTLTSTSGTLNLAGSFTNNGTFTNNSGTVNFNGTSAQVIGGSTATSFSSLTDANTAAALSVNTNANVSGTLNMNGAATLLTPAAAVVFNSAAAAGTITGTGTVQVTRTAATADYSNQYKFTTNTLTNLTVEYKGSGAGQTVSALSYGGLKINNSNGVTLGGNTTVNGTLTFTSGIVTTGVGLTLSLSSTGSVSQTSGWVAGNFQKNIALGATSKTFEIGDATNQRAVTVAFASVTTPGNLTATVSQSAGDHSSISTSGINSSKSVNRYWTFTNGGIVFTTYSITLNYVSGDVDAGATTGKFVVRKFNSPSTWSAWPTGTLTSTSAQATGITSFSDFAIGEQQLDHFTLALATPQTNAVAFTGTNTLTAQDVLGSTYTAFDASADNVTMAPNSPLTGTVSGLSGANKLTSAGDFSSGVANLTTLGMKYTGNTGSGTFTATSVSGKTGTSGSVTINGGAASAVQSTLTPTSASITANGSSTQVLTVQAKDASGNNLTVGGSAVTITKSSGTGTIGSVTDNLNGTYTATVTSPTSVGSGVFVATLGGNPVQSGGGSQTQSTITYTPGAANAVQSTLTPTSGSITANGVSTQVLTVQAKDANGNNLSTGGSTVTITKSSGTGTIGSVTDNSNGTYTATVTSPTSVGSGVFVATLGGNPVQSGGGSQTQSTITYTPGAANAVQSTLTPTSASITANSISTQVLTVQAKDASGNNLTTGGSTVTITKSSGIGTIGSVTDNLNGTYTATVTSPTSVGSGVFIATLGGSPVQSGGGSQTQATITYTAGTLDHFAIAAISSPQVATIPFTINITAQDANNNTVTSFNGTVNLSANAGTISPSTSGTFNNGLRSESVTLTVAGTGRTVSVDDGSGHTGTSGSFTVNKEPTTSTLTTSPNPSAFEQSVTLKDSVSGSFPDGGKVYFDIDNVVTDSAIINGSGVSSVTNSNMSAGSHAISAFYGGTSNFDTSTSNIVSQVVNQSGPTVSLVSNLNPSTFEQNVTFKVTVTNSSHTPTGSVNFYDGATLLGNVALSGDSALISSATLTAGSHTIKAVYSGDSNFKSDSSSITQVVNQSGPTVSLTSNLNPSVFEQNVTFKVTVTNSSHTPTGSVNFYDGATLLGNVALSGDSALISSAALTAGSHTIKAVYSGDSNFKSDSSSITQVVNQSGPTVSLTSNLNPSVFEQNVTFKVTVTNSSHTPTGSVNFYDGATLLGNVVLAGDSALFSSAALTAGSHTIKAVYSGDSNFKSDSSVLTQVVNQSGPTVSLTSNLNPSVFEQNVTFKVTVTNSNHTPTGSVNFYDGATLLGNVALAGDSALISSASLTAGSHTIKAVYSGDSNFKSDSSSITQVVNQSGPTVSLVSNLNPSTFEQNVIFKVTVTNSSHTPTGSVDFYDGATLLGNVALAGDSALISSVALTAGSHTIKAVYSGDSNFKSDSSSITQVVNQSGPTVSLISNLNPSVFEQNVTFKVTVTNSSHTPTGSVNFYDGATLLGNVVLAGDSALISSAALTAGSHTIKAVYSGDSNFKSDSSAVTQVVNQSGPTVSLTSNLNPSVFEQNVTFKVTVTNSSHTPTGSVDFYDGATLLGNVALAGDSALISSATLTAGSHTIKAVYSGDSNFKSDSSSITQVVNQSGPTVSLVSNLNPSVFEQNVTFKVTVTNSSHTPTGSVNFYDGATLLGNVALVGDSALISSAALTAGSHTIKAVYSGDSNFKSDSSSITQVVNQSGPTVSLVSNLNPSVFEQNVTFKVTVTNSSHTPTGSVNFYDGATLLGNVALAGDSALISSAALTAGSHSIKAVYSGDSNFKSDSSSITQVVNQSGPTVSLVSNLNPSTFEQNVTFKVTVTNSSHTPTGSVNFYDGATLLGNVALAGDSALISSASLTAGSHTIKAVYSGDSNFKSDSSTVAQVVTKKSTVGLFTTSVNPSSFGQTVVLKDSIVGSIPDSGTIQFKDGATNLGSPIAISLSGIATFSVSSFSTGTHILSAVYSGSGNFNGNISDTVNQVVNKQATTSLLVSSLNPSVFGQLVTFKDSVYGAGKPDGGTVQFKDGVANIGSAVAIDTNGVAKLTLSSFNAATHVVTAVYSGTGNYQGSSSNAVSQVVQKKTTTGIVTSLLNPSTYGQAVVLKDSVTNLPDSGTVQFKDGLTNLGSPVAINVNGVATVTLSTLSGSSHSISAVYSGTVNYQTNTSNTITQVVNQKTTTSVLTTSLNPSVFSQLVTFKDSVSGGGAPDSGTVQFKDGASNLGASVAVNVNGVATLTLSNINVGTHVITAVYSGTVNYQGSNSNTVSQVVHQKATSSILTASAVDLTPGQSVTLNDTVTGPPDGGTVQFMDGANTLGSNVSVDVNGVASYTTSSFSIGSHILSAVYSGTANFLNSISNTVNITVNDSTLFRSFAADSIALSHDNLGKLGKFVVRKPDKVYFGVIASVLAESANGLHMEFGSVIDTTYPFYTVPPSTKLPSDTKLGKWDFTFAIHLHVNDTVRIFGYGKKGKLQKVSKYYWKLGYNPVSANLKNPTINPNTLKMPMPNRINGLAEAFSLSGFSSTNGLLVGKARTDSVKNYGWILSTKYTYVLQSLSDKNGLQIGAPRGFDVYSSSGKPILGGQKSITPTKQNNKLIADMMALKLNIVLSAMGKTHHGFGELIYNDNSSNSLNNLMVKQIAAVGDSLMMGWQVDSTYLKGTKSVTVATHHFASSGVFANLDSTIEKINNAFEGKIDTVKFSDTLIYKGTRSLAAVPYLQANPNVIPTVIKPVISQQYEIPAAYKLYQNYPNPFNPSTTIQFEIPNPSVVTVKVYNILGQEVATLLDNSSMDEGTQTVNFNASNLASGVYFYRIVANQIADADNGVPSTEFTSIKKMMLVK